jgi:hypothetical protein
LTLTCCGTNEQTALECQPTNNILVLTHSISFFHHTHFRFLAPLENKFPLMFLLESFTPFSPTWEKATESTNCWLVSVLPLLPVSLLACLVNQKIRCDFDGNLQKGRCRRPHVCRRGQRHSCSCRDKRILSRYRCSYCPYVGMIITSQLVIYDIVKQKLGLAATGSH